MNTGHRPGCGGSFWFGSQLGHSPSDDCEQVTSPSNTAFLQGLVKMGVRLFTVLVWPGLVVMFMRALG